MNQLSTAASGLSGDPRAPGSRVDAAYQELRRRILSGSLPPGFQALEPRLADMLGMSRTPIREALVRLVEDGLIELRPRRGMRVLPLSARDVTEIEAVLACLVAEAAETIARRGLTLSEMAELDDAVAAMDVAVAAGDTARWAAADERFHRRLIALADNRRMTAIAGPMLDRAARVRGLVAARIVGTTPDAAPAALIEALRRGDPEMALEILRGQRRRRRRLLDALLPTLDLDRPAAS